MEQVAAPDQKPMGPLNQGPIRLLWILWAPGATTDPRGWANTALWRPLDTMGLKFGSHCIPCSYLGGAPDQTFLYVFLFLVCKIGHLLKNSCPNPEFLILEGSYPGTTTDLRRPAPSLGQSSVHACGTIRGPFGVSFSSEGVSDGNRASQKNRDPSAPKGGPADSGALANWFASPPHSKIPSAATEFS